MISQTPSIRPLTSQDLPQVRLLLAELGYDLEGQELARRFAAVTAAPAQLVLVADVEERAAGLIHAFIRPALEKPPEAVVQALVVDERRRGEGIGGRLMEAAECWAAEMGVSSVSVAAQVRREQAHAFYRGRGYAQIATSHLLRKTLF